MISDDTRAVSLARLDGMYFDEVDVWVSPQDWRKLGFGLCREWSAVITDQATDEILIVRSVRCDGLDCRCSGVIVGRGSRTCAAMLDSLEASA